VSPERHSIFALAAGHRAKRVVFLVWLVGIFIAAGPANLSGKFTDAEDNQSTSFLPGDAESTKALTATEELQKGELAPAVIVYRRESGLTPADRRKIGEDVRRLTRERLPSVIADGPRAASGRPAGWTGRRGASGQHRAAVLPPLPSRASPGTTRPSSARSARRTVTRRS
jgi:RND superfamily putative drug exporter